MPPTLMKMKPAAANVSVHPQQLPELRSKLLLRLTKAKQVLRNVPIHLNFSLSPEIHGLAGLGGPERRSRRHSHFSDGNIDAPGG